MVAPTTGALVRHAPKVTATFDATGDFVHIHTTCGAGAAAKRQLATIPTAASAQHSRSPWPASVNSPASISGSIKHRRRPLPASRRPRSRGLPEGLSPAFLLKATDWRRDDPQTSPTREETARTRLAHLPPRRQRRDRSRPRLPPQALRGAGVSQHAPRSSITVVLVRAFSARMWDDVELLDTPTPSRSSSRAPQRRRPVRNGHASRLVRLRVGAAL